VDRQIASKRQRNYFGFMGCLLTTDTAIVTRFFRVVKSGNGGGY